METMAIAQRVAVLSDSFLQTKDDGVCGVIVAQGSGNVATSSKMDSEGEDEKHRIAKIKLLRDLRKTGEVPPPYPNGWFALLPSSNLNKGKATEACVLGQNYVIWRGQSGKVYVADAYCPHLGAHLGVGGTVSEECIRCSFHGWKFQGSNGALAGIPYTNFEKMTDFAKIKMHSALEQNGLIYLWHHAEGDGPNWMPSKFDELKSGVGNGRGLAELETLGHIRDVVNGTELMRLITGHSQKTGRRSGGFASFFKCRVERWNKDRFTKHSRKLPLKIDTYLFGKIKLFTVLADIVQEGPSLLTISVKSVFMDIVCTIATTPVESMVQSVLPIIACNKYTPTFLATYVLKHVVLQSYLDITVINPKKNVKADKSEIEAFNSWYAQFYSERSRPMSLQEDSLDF